MFLTVEELRELTGYAFYSLQITWLRRNGWKFEVTGQNRPKVARTYFESRLGAASPTPRQENQPVVLTVKPNFQALNQLRAR